MSSLTPNQAAETLLEQSDYATSVVAFSLQNGKVKQIIYGSNEFRPEHRFEKMQLDFESCFVGLEEMLKQIQE